MVRAIRRWLIGSVAICVCLASDASAQYFGRNKVQYDRDRIRVLATEHFDVYYSAEDAAAAQIAGRLAERWYARLAQVFDHTLTGRQPLVLYGSHRRFEQTNVYGGFVDESTGGFTDARRRRIVLPFAGSLAETDHVLGHEIVHAFQFDIAERHRSPLAVPLWFIEGMAEYLTLGPDDPQTAMWMRDAVAAGALPRIGELSSPRHFPYRWGAAVWAQLASQYGDDLPARALRARRDVKRRLQELTGRSLDELTSAWHASLREKYGDTGGRADAEPLISSAAGGGRLNLGASLSPDGRRLVFLSERDQFSIDLYLADAATGRVIRKLVTTAATTRVESLQYLHSAGAWEPSGGRFALATIRRGRASLLLLDVDGGGRAQELPLPGIDEIYSPAWSPDGRSIAFSALKRGFTDLFVLALASRDIRQLTADGYADLQPAWSPDGATLAFATDRFTTSLGKLSFGEYRIGLLDLATAAVRAAPGLTSANHIDPAWSPGGDALFFVADPGGVSNVFRIDVAAGAVHQVTDVSTGVSGVTRISPALSVAARSGELAFTVFRGSGYEVHKLPAGDRLTGTRVEAIAAPPVARAAETVDAIEPVPPLPALAMTPRDGQHTYRPSLSLEGVGSPYLSAGGGPVGGYIAGGASLLFGDLLGDQQLLTTLHVSSRLDESAVGALYVNRARRWSWGIAVQQTPDVRLRTHAVHAATDGQRVVTRERDRLLWTNREVGGFAAYPVNRSRRLEISSSVRQIAFARERRTELVSLVSGRIVEHDTEPLPAEPAVAMLDAGLALVGDTTIFGATGPMLGSRYRLQATATGGGLRYASVLADYRRYLMPVRPYTLALRVVHSGRYGGDAGDFRLRDAYVGSPTLVRGYGPGAVARSECPAGSADCPALNTLLANRVVAAKLELRVPVWSTLRATSKVRYGPLPMDAFLFADAGAGWGGEQRFGPGGSDGTIVRSVGAGVRANVFGLVVEAAAVRPLDLVRATWSFAFTLRPGF